MSTIGTIVPPRLSSFIGDIFRAVRRFVRSMGSFVMLIVALLAATAAGLGSAWYMIDRGSFITVDRIGPWESWADEGNPEADPYTRAHLAREGRLSVTSTSARYYLARTDSDGRALNSSCEYLVEGPPIEAKWWSLTLFDRNGRLISNGAQRYGFNSAEIVRRTDGGHGIQISRKARAGNWLPAGQLAGRELTLWLSVFVPSTTVGAGYVASAQLPAIRRLSCG